MPSGRTMTLSGCSVASDQIRLNAEMRSALNFDELQDEAFDCDKEGTDAAAE